STRLVEAAQELGKQQGAMQLRYMQTLTEIAGERSSTIVFPLPMDLMNRIQNLVEPKPPDS
ncbi:MAG: slipin family protein, partial [Gammaproteobacteria bacterium]|nr:slipin family protein [Gammaproteobacteria bacterium]